MERQSKTFLFLIFAFVAGYVCLSAQTSYNATINGAPNQTISFIALNPVTTASIGGSALLAGTCTASATVSVAGAIVGRNVQITPSDGSLQQAGTIAQASVTAAGTVSYQICGTGLVSITPSAKTYSIQVLE